MEQDKRKIFQATLIFASAFGLFLTLQNVNAGHVEYCNTFWKNQTCPVSCLDSSECPKDTCSNCELSQPECESTLTGRYCALVNSSTASCEGATCTTSSGQAGACRSGSCQALTFTPPEPAPSPSPPPPSQPSDPCANVTCSDQAGFCSTTSCTQSIYHASCQVQNGTATCVRDSSSYTTKVCTGAFCTTSSGADGECSSGGQCISTSACIYNCVGGEFGKCDPNSCNQEVYQLSQCSNGLCKRDFVIRSQSCNEGGSCTISSGTGTCKSGGCVLPQSPSPAPAPAPSPQQEPTRTALSTSSVVTTGTQQIVTAYVSELDGGGGVSGGFVNFSTGASCSVQGGNCSTWYTAPSTPQDYTISGCYSGISSTYFDSCGSTSTSVRSPEPPPPSPSPTQTTLALSGDGNVEENGRDDFGVVLKDSNGNIISDRTVSLSITSSNVEPAATLCNSSVPSYSGGCLTVGRLVNVSCETGGSATVSASFAGDSTYQASTTTYTARVSCKTKLKTSISIMAFDWNVSDDGSRRDFFVTLKDQSGNVLSNKFVDVSSSYTSPTPLNVTLCGAQARADGNTACWLSVTRPRGGPCDDTKANVQLSASFPGDADYEASSYTSTLTFKVLCTLDSPFTSESLEFKLLNPVNGATGISPTNAKLEWEQFDLTPFDHNNNGVTPQNSTWYTYDTYACEQAIPACRDATYIDLSIPGTKTYRQTGYGTNWIMNANFSDLKPTTTYRWDTLVSGGGLNRSFYSVNGPFSFTTGEANRPPNIIPLQDLSVNEDQILTFRVQATDPEDPVTSLAFKATNLPSGASFTEVVSGTDKYGQFSWRPNFDQAGTYNNVTFTVTDPAGLSASQSINITVNNVNRAPFLASNPNPADGVFDVDVSPTFSWTGGDPDGDAVTYHVYFGTTSPPPFHSTTTTPSIQIKNLEYGKRYYWKIYTTDGQYFSDPIWSFTTKPPPDIFIHPRFINSTQDLTFDFSDTGVGAKKDLAFWIFNKGASTLNVTLSTSSSFSVAPLSFGIDPGSFQREVVVSFTPLALGSYQAALKIASNDPDTPEINIRLLGAGVTPEKAKRYNTSFQIQARGDIINFVSRGGVDQPCPAQDPSCWMKAGLPFIELPKKTNNYTNVLGKIDMAGILGGKYGAVVEKKGPCAPATLFGSDRPVLDGKIYRCLGDLTVSSLLVFQNGGVGQRGNGLVIVSRADPNDPLSGGDLIIRDDIKYDPAKVFEIKRLASVGFIVEDEVRVDPQLVASTSFCDSAPGHRADNTGWCDLFDPRTFNVSGFPTGIKGGSIKMAPVEISGAYYTAGIFKTSDSTIPIKVRGLVMAKRFELARVAGDYSKAWFETKFGNIYSGGDIRGTTLPPPEEPTEQIIYDGRIVINPPPGFADLTSNLPRWR